MDLVTNLLDVLVILIVLFFLDVFPLIFFVALSPARRLLVCILVILAIAAIAVLVVAIGGAAISVPAAAVGRAFIFTLVLDLVLVLVVTSDATGPTARVRCGRRRARTTVAAGLGLSLDLLVRPVVVVVRARLSTVATAFALVIGQVRGGWVEVVVLLGIVLVEIVAVSGRHFEMFGVGGGSKGKWMMDSKARKKKGVKLGEHWERKCKVCCCRAEAEMAQAQQSFSADAGMMGGKAVAEECWFAGCLSMRLLSIVLPPLTISVTKGSSRAVSKMSTFGLRQRTLGPPHVASFKSHGKAPDIRRPALDDTSQCLLEFQGTIKANERPM